VIDPVTGTIRLKPKARAEDEMDLDLKSVRISRVRE